MTGFVPLATPWWVNLLLLTPAVPYLLSLRGKLRVGRGRLLVIAAFGTAFGFVEAAVVVYLRAATGLWPGPAVKALTAFPAALMRVEVAREAATMVMLLAVAIVAGQRLKEKFIAFLWAFAFWDFFYYVWLRVTIGWPSSLLNSDILFLIPGPWVAQVWFPMLVSGLTIVAVWVRD